MTAIDVSCPDCSQQPGEPCRSGDAISGYKTIEGFHASRVEAAAFISGAGNNDAPSTEQFEQAVLDTGLI
jgi:hypothetical protein